MKKILLIFLFAVFTSACGQVLEKELFGSTIKKQSVPSFNGKSMNNDADFKRMLERKTPKCLFFTEEKKRYYQYNETVKCFLSASYKLRPLLVNKILEKNQAASHKTMSRVLEIIAEDSYIEDITKSKYIKKLIDAGASTKNVTLNLVTYNNTNFACKSVMLIIKSNKAIYQKEPVPEWNRYDIHHLADTEDGRSLCPKAIQLLISYNPKLRNVRDIDRGFTPLHYYLVDSQHTDWNIQTAKKLMTKENINIIARYGYIPLDMLIDHNNKTPWDLELIRFGVQLGADISLFKDSILKRPDLISLLKKRL